MSVNSQLQKNLFTALANNKNITDILGGANIYDSEPLDLSCNYLLIDSVIIRDWSTASESGLEHTINLIAYSLSDSRLSLVELVDEIRNVLNEIPTELGEDVLVNVMFKMAEIKRIRKGVHNYRAEMVLRAVTETTTKE